MSKEDERRRAERLRQMRAAEAQLGAVVRGSYVSEEESIRRAVARNEAFRAAHCGKMPLGVQKTLDATIEAGKRALAYPQTTPRIGEIAK